MSAQQRVTSIPTDRAPKPAGHDAQAVAAGAKVFVSGPELHYGYLVEIDAIAVREP